MLRNGVMPMPAANITSGPSPSGVTKTPNGPWIITLSSGMSLDARFVKSPSSLMPSLRRSFDSSGADAIEYAARAHGVPSFSSKYRYTHCPGLNETMSAGSSGASSSEKISAVSHVISVTRNGRSFRTGFSTIRKKEASASLCTPPWISRSPLWLPRPNQNR